MFKKKLNIYVEASFEGGHIGAYLGLFAPIGLSYS